MMPFVGVKVLSKVMTMARKGACWYQPQEVWNGYAYVIQQVRFCN